MAVAVAAVDDTAAAAEAPELLLVVVSVLTVAADGAVVAAGATTDPLVTVTAPFIRETAPPLLPPALGADCLLPRVTKHDRCDLQIGQN